VSGADDLVVLPPQSITILPLAVLFARLAVPTGKWFAMLGEKHQAVEKVAHDSDLLGPKTSDKKGTDSISTCGQTARSVVEIDTGPICI
jgi:hypothetical protein